MTPEQEAVARTCLNGSEGGTMTFPEILGALSAAGIEGYLVDFRAAQATYYAADGRALALDAGRSDVPIAPGFDATALVAAIREAQTLAPGYTYRGFCDKAKQAGCAGYIVSLPGRRVVYYGRTAEAHVEMFPD